MHTIHLLFYLLIHIIECAKGIYFVKSVVDTVITKLIKTQLPMLSDLIHKEGSVNFRLM